MTSAADMDSQLKAIYAQLEDGFKEKAKLDGDQATATAHLKQMTNKMAESKRLIKEYEKAAQGDATVDLASVASRKKEMVSQLNAFVNKKKAAQAVVAAKAEKAAAAAEAAAEAAAKKAEKSKGKAPAAAAAGAGAAGAAEGQARAGAGAGAASDPLFGSPAKKEGGGLSSVPETGAAAGGPVNTTGVDLQMMEAGELVQFGRGKIKETDESIERSKAVVATTIEIGAQTAEALKHQTHQMERIVDELDEIHFSMKKSMKLIKDLTRGLATDKCILTLLFVVVCGVVAVIAIKIAGLDKDDEIAKLPGTTTPSPEEGSRRLLMMMSG